MEGKRDAGNAGDGDVRELQGKLSAVLAELRKVVVGQEEVMEQVLMALFCRGHALLVGVPGLAKTLLVSSVSRTLDLENRRVQFTPDLMPSDITGAELLEVDQGSGARHFRFAPGPVFANLLLADEVNRTPPKTQAALLEAMQEEQVTVGGKSYPLPDPFVVLATQNPIEQEGTYPLPEAQLDRFLFSIKIDYPAMEEEREIIRRVTGGEMPSLEKLLDQEEIRRMRDLVGQVPAAEHVIDYAAKLVRASRPGEDGAPDFVTEHVEWGAGPRAGIALVTAGKARAVMRGRLHVTTADIAAVALPVLRHRIVTGFTAEAAGLNSDEIIRQLLEVVTLEEELAL